jgi:hypothetical protein
MKKISGNDIQLERICQANNNKTLFLMAENFKIDSLRPKGDIGNTSVLK